MEKVDLGGVKVLENCSYVAISCLGVDNPVGGICLHCASERGNLAFLSHIAGGDGMEAHVGLCAEKEAAASAFIMAKGMYGGLVRFERETGIVSIFPHAKRPGITGRLLHALASVPVKAIASSPSTVSAVIESTGFEASIGGLFERFSFPTYRSPLQWHAAYQGQSRMLREVICSYQERVIKTYGVTRNRGLDLWRGFLPHSGLEGLGAALLEVEELGVSMPFFALQMGGDNRGVYAFCFPSVHGEAIQGILSRSLVGFDRMSAAAAFFLNGPHFGDRHGIAHALLQCLHGAGIGPLAFNCVTSSMSVVVREEDLDAAILSLDGQFHISDEIP